LVKADGRRDRSDAGRSSVDVVECRRWTTRFDDPCELSLPRMRARRPPPSAEFSNSSNVIWSLMASGAWTVGREPTGCDKRRREDRPEVGVAGAEAAGCRPRVGVDRSAMPDERSERNCREGDAEDARDGPLSRAAESAGLKGGTSVEGPFDIAEDGGRTLGRL
jgi:hypothetical protein